MEDQMDNLLGNATHMVPRRGFIGRIAGAMAVGFAGFTTTAARAQTPPARAGRADRAGPRELTAAGGADGPECPGPLKGRHRQVVDGYEVNSVFPLAFAYTFLAPN